MIWISVASTMIPLGLTMMLLCSRTCLSFQDYTTCGEQALPLDGRLTVVGGQRADDGEWPWQAHMIVDGVVTCGASLVQPDWILTAAHCLGTILTEPSLLQFRMGSNSAVIPGPHVQWRTAEEIYMHPGYTIRSRTNHDMDIALIKLTAPFNISNHVRTVCLPTTDIGAEFPVSTPVTVTGWGRTYSDFSSDDLLEVTMEILDQSECAESYADADVGVTDNMLCAGVREGFKDACQGDSGSPLVTQRGTRWFQLGVVSFGINCGHPIYPGVYTRVASFEDWIAPIFQNREPFRPIRGCSCDEFECRYGGCLPNSMKCDGKFQCSSKSDEDNCDDHGSHVTQSVSPTQDAPEVKAAQLRTTTNALIGVSTGAGIAIICLLMCLAMQYRSISKLKQRTTDANQHTESPSRQGRIVKDRGAENPAYAMDT